MRLYHLALVSVPVLAANFLSTQPGTAISENTWTALTPSGITGHRLDATWMKAHYVPSIDMSCLLGAYRQRSTEPNESWICYSFKENKLYLLDVASEWQNERMFAAGHAVAGSSVDTTISVLYGYGGFSGSQVSERGQGTYAYDFNGQSGRYIMTDSIPNYNTNQPAGQFDPLRNKLVLHGGSDFTGTHEFSPVTNDWSHGTSCVSASAGCPDPSLKQGSMAYRTVDSCMYMFGGISGATLKNDLNKYCSGTTWSALSPTGGPPAARQMAGFVYMSAQDKFLMYGGGDTSSTGLRTDTWIYDPVANTWTQLTPSASPTGTTAAVVERMTYVPGDDVVVLFNLQSSGSGNIWAFRYQGTGNAGWAAAPSYTPTSGGLNRNSTAWAKYPALAGSSAATLSAWVETGPSSDTSSDAQMFSPYASTWVGGSRTNLGSAYNSIASSSTTMQSDIPSVAYVGTTPWICWTNNNYSSITARVETAHWTGSAWTNHGAVGQLGSVSTYFQGPCQVADVAGTPHFIIKEEQRDSVPSHVRAYVIKWTGSAYAAVGGALNREGNASDMTHVGSISLTSNGTNPCAAWTEYTATPSGSGGGNIVETFPNAYASCWNGSSWTSQGGVVQPTDAKLAFDVAAFYFGSQLHVALTEKSVTESAKLFVRKWNGSAWSTVGTVRNRDGTNGWAYKPRLASDGTDLYVGWVEQGNVTTWAYSQASFGYRPNVYVDKWDGSAWSHIGGSLNADSYAGAAERVDIAFQGTDLTAIWSEVKHGAFRTVYMRSLAGGEWSTSLPHSYRISGGIKAGGGTVLR